MLKASIWKYFHYGQQTPHTEWMLYTVFFCQMFTGQESYSLIVGNGG
jgi:hypothetical protein